MTRRLIALAAALILAAGGAVARAPVLTVSDTRPFGYFLGDAVQREVTLRVGPGDVLDTASLPRPGPLNYWLELSRADITSSAAFARRTASASEGSSPSSAAGSSSPGVDRRATNGMFCPSKFPAGVTPQ